MALNYVVMIEVQTLDDVTREEMHEAVCRHLIERDDSLMDKHAIAYVDVAPMFVKVQYIDPEDPTDDCGSNFIVNGQWL